MADDAAARKSRKGLLLTIVVSLVALAVIAAGVGWRWASRPADAAVEAFEAGEHEQAITFAETGLMRPGRDRLEHEVAGLALLALGRATEARPHLEAAREAGSLDVDERGVAVEPLARRLLAQGREAELSVLVDHLARSTDGALPPSLRALGAFADHAAGRLSLARETYAALLAENALSGDEPLRALVEAQAESATQQARRGLIPVVVARDGTPLAWRVAEAPAGSALKVGDELEALLRGAPPSALPGLGEGDLDGRVVLALDPTMQRHAMSVFRNERGATVMVDARTGDILAAAADDEAAPMTALAGMFTPGSTLKAPVMGAFLESGEALERAVPHDCRGNDFVLEGEILYDWSPHGRVEDLERALVVSCNTVFAKAGLALGASRLREALAPYGLDDGKLVLASGDELPAGSLPPGPLSPTRLARAAMGLDEATITPLQAAVMAAAITGDGEVRPPRLVLERLNVVGETVPARRDPAAARRALSPQTARRVREAMVAVVTAPDGTGRGARVADVPVALKTGTTGGDGEPLNAVFVGAVPAARPEVAFSLFTQGSGRSLDVSRRVLGPWLEDVWRDRSLTGGDGA